MFEAICRLHSSRLPHLALPDGCRRDAVYKSVLQPSPIFPLSREEAQVAHMRKEHTIMGRIWKLGDNINTDVIIPGRYNVTTDRAQLAQHCLCEILPEFAPQVQPGDILVAGHNFGCGSSREHAPSSILGTGVKVVIARSFARIFYRNAVNIGLPILICEEAVLASEDGQELDVDLSSGRIQNITTGQIFQAEPLDPFVARIVEAGGIINYILAEGTLR